MTEAEWSACTDPRPMLEFLRGNVSDRKLRLFACACCNRIRHLLTDERSRKAVEMAERFADGLASEQEREAADHAATEASRAVVLTRQASDFTTPERFTIAARAAGFTASDVIDTEAGLAIVAASSLIARHESVSPGRREADNTISSSTLRDIIGNPFRVVLLNRALLTWAECTIPKLAQAIYDDRAFDHLLVLADALEEAGCTDADILSHCRGPGPHVRGCWVIDLLLAKS